MYAVKKKGSNKPTVNYLLSSKQQAGKAADLKVVISQLYRQIFTKSIICLHPHYFISAYTNRHNQAQK